MVNDALTMRNNRTGKSSKHLGNTTTDWNGIWLTKFGNISRIEKFEPNRTAQMREMLSVFLSETPGSPYFIHPEKFTGFLKNASIGQLETLRFFYDKVAVSKKYEHNVKNYLSELNTEMKKRAELPQKNITNCSSAITTQYYEGRFETDAGRQNPLIYPDAERRGLLEKLKLEIDARNLSSRTLKGYMGVVSRFLESLSVESSKDWYKTFKEYLVSLRDNQKLAPSTINNYAAAISFFMEEVLEVKPGEDLFIRMKKGKVLPRVHSSQDIAAILTAPTNAKHRLILMLVYGCGLRLGEVCVLKPEDIDLYRKIIWIRKAKGKKDRMVMLDETLLPYIAAWLKNGCGLTYLFEGYNPGEYLSKRTVEKIYTDACHKRGVNPQGGLHSLRHSFATHLLEQGVDLRYIQELLGHASSKTTEIYTHVAANKIVEIRSPIAGLLLNTV
jgi:site-specific recombinase XerD